MLGLLVVMLYLAFFAPAVCVLGKALASEDDDPRRPARLRRAARAGLIGLVCAVLLTTLLMLSGVWVEYLWADSVGYASAYLTRVLTKFGLFIGFGLTAGALAFLLTSRMPLPAKAEIEALGLPRHSSYYATARENWNKIKSIFVTVKVLFPLLVAFVNGLVAAGLWEEALLYRNAQVVGESDPIFGNDLGFYLFSLPLQSATVTILCVVTFSAALLNWVAAFVLTTNLNDFGDEYQGAMRTRIVAAACRATSAWTLFLAVAFWYDRYELLQSTSGRVYGAGYADLYGTLPVYWLLIIVLGTVTFLLAVLPVTAVSALTQSRRRVISCGIAALLLLAGCTLYPAFLQAFVVSPSEFDVEKPYLEYQMAATRKAFNLDTVEVRDYTPRAITLADVKKNAEAVANIRLSEWKAIKSVFEQKQELRPYYEFPDVDIIRAQVDGRYKMLMLASRELDINLLPEESKRWNNEHLVYTHGFGVVASCAAEFDHMGHPVMRIKDLPPVSDIPELTVSRPEIYFGELTKHHVFVNTTGIEEFSYPRKDENAYSHYEGKAGVEIGSGLRRLAFAWHLDGIRVLRSQYLTPESRVLMHREVHERIEQIAPFLALDRDMYKVITDEGRLVYLLDAYTMSSNYPYAEQFGGVNYVRNSVKITLDAYEGEFTFYIFDEKDPLLAAWRAAFPELFRSSKDMPADLRRHVRYPEDLMNLQAHVWATYHMSDLRKFYGLEDRWAIAHETYLDDEREAEAYYVITTLPGQTREEMVLMVPFTPFNKANSRGWMAGRCDGEHYGQLLVYDFSEQEHQFGPMQVEAEIDQHPEISGQLTLWKQKGSDVIRGNLLMLPVEGGLLFVEPIYLCAERGSIPKLVKVAAFANGNVAWGDTLDQALAKVFSETTAPAPVQVAEAAQNSSPPRADATQVRQLHDQLEKYLRLTGEGKLEEAGAELGKLRALLQDAVKNGEKQ